MNELEELRKRREAELLEDMNKQYAGEAQQEAQLQQEIGALEAVVKTKLTKEALQRYGNLKTGHPEKAIQLLVVLGRAIQGGGVKQSITDEQLRQVLVQLAPPKKQFNITRK